VNYKIEFTFRKENYFSKIELLLENISNYNSCMDSYVAFVLRALETFQQLGDILHTSNMEIGYFLGGCLGLEDEHWAFWRRALSPRWHGIAWMLTWKLVLDVF
jgi:hypothetical protein